MAGLALTRQGIVVVIASVMAVAIGRVFGIIELYVIGAGFAATVVVAVVYVVARRPRIEAHRWIHPAVLVAGDTGHVDIRLQHTGSVRHGAVRARGAGDAHDDRGSRRQAARGVAARRHAVVVGLPGTDGVTRESSAWGRCD